MRHRVSSKALLTIRWVRRHCFVTASHHRAALFQKRKLVRFLQAAGLLVGVNFYINRLKPCCFIEAFQFLPLEVSLKAWAKVNHNGVNQIPEPANVPKEESSCLISFLSHRGLCRLSKSNREQSICFLKRFAAPVLTGFQAFPSNNDRLRGQCRQPAGQWL